MNRFFSLRSWVLLALLTWSPALPDPTIPFNAIRSLYVEGEFEKIRVQLESYLKQSGKSAGAKEKIFAYKYLGVIYAAGPEGYPVAETYFYQLLGLAPNAHLSNLYVSSAVENLFAKTRERFQRETRENSRFDDFGNPLTEGGKDNTAAAESEMDPNPQSAQSRPVNPGRRKNPQVKAVDKAPVWPWIVGVGVAGAVGGYFWYAGRDKDDTEIHDAR